MFLQSVTEAPGPSYLTESIYYFEDHTPSPELSKRQPYHPHEGNEDETFGVGNSINSKTIINKINN